MQKPSQFKIYYQEEWNFGKMEFCFSQTQHFRFPGYTNTSKLIFISVTKR